MFAEAFSLFIVSPSSSLPKQNLPALSCLLALFLHHIEISHLGHAEHVLREWAVVVVTLVVVAVAVRCAMRRFSLETSKAMHGILGV